MVTGLSTEKSVNFILKKSQISRPKGRGSPSPTFVPKVGLGGKCQMSNPILNVKSKYSRKKSEIRNPKFETMTKIQMCKMPSPTLILPLPFGEGEEIGEGGVSVLNI